MTASDNRPRSGDSADGCTDYDREYQLHNFLESQTDLICDLAGETREYSDFETLADKYRQLASEAEFVADVIQTFGVEEQREE